MKDIKEIIDECNISFADIQKNYKTEYDFVLKREKEWLNNVEDKTYRLTENAKKDIDYVISRLKTDNYQFTNNDTSKLSVFVSQINGIIRVSNWVNNFKEGTSLDNGRQLHLFELFNAIKKAGKYSEFKFELKGKLKSFISIFYSIVKHCQNSNQYPIYYKFWKNILREILKGKDDYDSLCAFYKKNNFPDSLGLGAYFGTIGVILAKKITDNNIIKEENDKNYNYIRKSILNIHYFDLITGYKRKPNYYIIGSKYGDRNNIDVFPEMEKQQVVSVGFARHLDLTDFYLSDDAEIKDYLKEQKENPNSITALKHFLNIKVGDKIAIKADGSPKGRKGFLSIVGICEVIANEEGQVYNYDPKGLGHTLNVKFIEIDYKEYEIGGYGSTVHKLSITEHIKKIFGNTTNITKDEKVNYRIRFQDWLNNDNYNGSNKPDNYIRAMEILSGLLKNNLFEETDYTKLGLLYEDLVSEQKKETGKYFFKDAPSYGNNGFYSASIKAYINFLKEISSISIVSEPSEPMKTAVKNKLAQAICVIGDSGVGKTYRVNKTLKNEGHKALFIIIDNMWQHILFDYSPDDRKYRLTKVGEFIKMAANDPENHYTVVIDECHKNLEIINDVLLQAISTKRNNGIRFLALNSLVDKEFDFLPESKGNRVLPDNLGFLFISSKSDIIEGNDDLKNRIEIIELMESDQIDTEHTIEYLLGKIKKEESSEYTN
jgi:hypothetical protein